MKGFEPTDFRHNVKLLYSEKRITKGFSGFSVLLWEWYKVR